MIPYSRRVAIAFFLLLSGCAPDVNGHYLGYVSALFGFVRARVILTVDGEAAMLRWSDGTRITLQAARYGDRLVLADSRGDTLSFHIADQGATLRCAQCRAVQLPETWERQVVNHRPVPLRDANDPSPPPAHCAAEPRSTVVRSVRRARQCNTLTLISYQR
jgi:hypothetical protein